MKYNYTNNNNNLTDFINMYNAIIKHCTNKSNHFEIKLCFFQDKLYFKVIDNLNNTTLHNETIKYNYKEYNLIMNTITNEFIKSNIIIYASYIPINNNDAFYLNQLKEINYNYQNIYHNDNTLYIHKLETSKYCLSIYQLNGISKETEKLHQKALEKIKNYNKNRISLS